MADKTASGSGGSSAQDSSKKVGLIGLVGIVISAMIGGGIYNLPQNMAADASAGAIIIAWVVTGIGIWFIANTFRILSAARPELTNGLYTYAEKGFGKRTPVSDYPEHHRGGQGVFTITMTEKKGLLAVMKIVAEDDEIMIMSEEGVCVRTPVSGISELGRSTQGVCVMKTADKDRVTAVAISSRGKKKKASGAQVEGEELDENAIDELEDGAEGTAEIESVEEAENAEGDEE